MSTLKGFLFLLLLSANTVLAQGVVFDSLQSWSSLLDTAKARQLPIFVDAYTTWCAPCKKMVRDVFPDSAVGTYFNARFVNVTIDMEKGEGPMLAQLFHIEAYPTLLFIAPDGALLHKGVGYQSPENLIDLAQTATNQEMNLGAQEARYARGDRTPAFLLKYAMVRYQLRDGSHQTIAEAYLNTQPDWATPQNLKLIYTLVEDTDTEMFRYLVRQHEVFDTVYGAANVKRRTLELAQNALQNPIHPITIEQADELFELVYPERAERMSASFRLTYYREQGNREAYIEAAKKYLAKYHDQATELSETAYTFTRITTDKNLLKQALEWAKAAVTLEDAYYTREVVAQVYNKMGKKNKTRRAAKAAIKKAELDGDDATEMKKLLDVL